MYLWRAVQLSEFIIISAVRPTQLTLRLICRTLASPNKVIRSNLAAIHWRSDFAPRQPFSPLRLPAHSPSISFAIQLSRPPVVRPPVRPPARPLVRPPAHSPAHLCGRPSPPVNTSCVFFAASATHRRIYAVRAGPPLLSGRRCRPSLIISRRRSTRKSGVNKGRRRPDP